jgi:hypothetical protein
MTRCMFLDRWLDDVSKDIDKWEKETGAKFLDIKLR